MKILCACQVLKPTKMVYPYLGQYVQSGCSSLYRSKTFPGVAHAMAAQWG